MPSDVPAAVAAVLDGDPEAFQPLVEAHQDSVWRLLHYLLDDEATAEDLFQQTFLLAYRHLDRFDRTQDFGVWVRAIARNAVRKHLRDHGREERRRRRYRGLVEEWLTERSGGEDDPLWQERLRALRRCRSDLDADAATLLRLYYEQHQTMPGIATALGRSEGACRRLLSRIRLRLRACIEHRLRTERT